jgi:C-terminal processing protease CtpA/Prc
MMRGWRLGVAALVVVSAMIGGQARLSQAQGQFDSLQRERARRMLKFIADDVRKHYYDPKFHGVDLDARFREADQKIKDAKSLGDAFTAIYGMLEWLHDSHTFFLPPDRPLKFDYGFQMQMMGDNDFITQVRPGTDASQKLKAGDQVLMIEGYRAERPTLWEMEYYFHRLAPVSSLHLLLLAPDGSQRQVAVQAKMRQGKRIADLTGSSGSFDIEDLIRDEEAETHLLRQRYEEAGEQLIIWKMPEFDITGGEVDKMFDRVRRHQTLVLDLRGNPGGSVDTLARMVGNVFDHDVKIADRTGRKEMKPLVAKLRGKDVFQGKLIVLVDGGSASAAELFARTIQLEHRGVVLGDHSSGSVMESRIYTYHFESGASTLGNPAYEQAPAYENQSSTFVFFACAITDADLTMKDRKSLEQNGVAPDEVILPTAQDLAAGRDPVLSRAAELAGVKLDPAAAGKMFPFEWQPF